MCVGGVCVGPVNYFLRAFFPPHPITLCRLVSRCPAAIKENHRPQELRVPDVEARGVPGVSSGRAPWDSVECGAFVLRGQRDCFHKIANC